MNLTNNMISTDIYNQWKLLTHLWNEKFPLSSVSLTETTPQYTFTLQESYNSKTVFSYQRNVDGTRYTLIPQTLVGLTLLSHKDSSVYITEGVSDFIAFKLCHPELNVLAHTVLKWNLKDINFLKFFRIVHLFSDSDTAGISAVVSARNVFIRHNIDLKLMLPSSGYKDLASQFVKTGNC